MSKPTKVVYLFGAGATHAEIIDHEEMAAEEIFDEENSLLISDLSERVLKKITRSSINLGEISFIKESRKKGNIELLISLVESNNIKNSEKITKKIKDIIEKEILGTINRFSGKKEFYLHKALLEFHEKIEEKEELIGLITLNYDDILDDAYFEIYQDKPNYCLTSDACSKSRPLLKLHGSFSWTDILVDGKEITIPIMPLGVKKNYLEIYYSFVWGRTIEVLSQCDILRVIGCSLNQSDWGLMDLLFKAHLCAGKPFEIQIIDLESVGDDIQKRFGFLPLIRKSNELEGRLLSKSNEFEGGLLVNYETELKNPGSNIFKIWLMKKIDKNLDEKQIDDSKYIKKIFDL